MSNFFTANISDVDPIISEAIDDEVRRQTNGLELIASENFVSEAVLQTMGTVFTNKYAEGYPGKRYYGGCEFADVVENAAIDRAKQIFGADRFALHVNDRKIWSRITNSKRRFSFKDLRSVAGLTCSVPCGGHRGLARRLGN